mgnify:CR=1 FL=1
MIEYLRILRFGDLYKNIIILVPLIITGGLENKSYIIEFLEGFLTLSIINLLCYLINDFTDQKIDKINKLKKYKRIIKQKFIFLLIVLFFLALFFLFIFDLYKNIFIYAYLLNFFLYNFLIKKIKILDIIFLTNFYIIRILFGSNIFDTDLTIGFLLFFIFLFLGLSLSKRIIQIQINNLKIGNTIIKYSLNDQHKFLISIIFFFTMSILIFCLYLLNNFYFDYIYLNLFQKTTFSLDVLLILFLFFSVSVIRMIYQIKKKIIQIDLYKFFLNDKFNYIIILIVITYALVKIYFY